MTPPDSPVRPRRAPRADGDATRQQILQVAGRLYAERGVDGVTSRAICLAAGINMAAVNYHFGSKDGLYEAVLVAAHGQLVQLDELEALARMTGSPEARLGALIRLILSHGVGDLAASWALRVLLRELTGPPSVHFEALRRQAIEPKARLGMRIVAGVLGVPPGDPLVQRALAFVIMPCAMLLTAPRDRVLSVLPGLAADPQTLADDMTAYALAGLAALARRKAGGGGVAVMRGGRR